MLPTIAPYDSRAEAPQPVGLVGAHRSQRPGSGTELAGIRPFEPGDRLRRINWRVSLRTRTLHVVSTRAEEDTGVLLVVDALADHGVSGGIDGAASSLDLSVRAASAIAEHHVRSGDRVALRVVGRGRELVGYGAGARHLRRVQDTLADDPPRRGRRDATPGVAAARCHRRHRRHRAVADAGRVDRHRGRDPDPARGAGARRRHAARRRPPRRRRRAPTRRGRARLADAQPGADGRAGAARRPSAARWWRGAGPAPSTTCCAGWPGAPSCPGWWPDDARCSAVTPRRRQLVLRALIAPRPGRRASCDRTRPGTGRRGGWCSPCSVWPRGFAVLPESPSAPRVLLAVLVWWAVALDDGLHPAVLVAAAALLVAHLAAVLASYGPRRDAGRRRRSCGCGSRAARWCCSGAGRLGLARAAAR